MMLQRLKLVSQLLTANDSNIQGCLMFVLLRLQYTTVGSTAAKQINQSLLKICDLQLMD